MINKWGDTIILAEDMGNSRKFVVECNIVDITMIAIRNSEPMYKFTLDIKDRICCHEDDNFRDTLIVGSLDRIYVYDNKQLYDNYGMTPNFNINNNDIFLLLGFNPEVATMRDIFMSNGNRLSVDYIETYRGNGHKDILYGINQKDNRDMKISVQEIFSNKIDKQESNAVYSIPRYGYSTEELLTYLPAVGTSGFFMVDSSLSLLIKESTLLEYTITKDSVEVHLDVYNSYPYTKMFENFLFCRSLATINSLRRSNSNEMTQQIIQSIHNSMQHRSSCNDISELGISSYELDNDILVTSDSIKTVTNTYTIKPKYSNIDINKFNNNIRANRGYFYAI